MAGERETDARGVGMGVAAAIISASVLGSRLLGLLRNVLLGSTLGVSTAGDVYQAAFFLPDLLNYFLAGGYLTITFIPLLSRRLVAGRIEDGWEAFSAVFRVVAIAIVGLTVVLMIFTGPLVDLLYPRLDPAETVQVATLTRIVLPAQVFFVLGSLFMAVQYAHKRFLVPALAPLIYNLGIIVGGLISPTPAGFIWGAVAGAAIGNFGVQWWGAVRTGLRFTRTARRHPAVREYFVLAFPLMAGQSIAVLDEQFTRVFGQLGEDGAIAALNYARQLNMVGVGVIAQAAGVAAYPFLAGLAAEGRLAELADTTVRTVRRAVYVSVGAATIAVAVAVPAVRVIYERGEFTAADTTLVASLLGFYALSVPAWGAHQVYSRAFYARRQMWLPVGIGSAATVFAVVLAIVLVRSRDAEGLAIASSVSMGAYALALGTVWHVREGVGRAGGVLRTLARSAVASLPAVFLGRLAADAVPGEGFLSSAAAAGLGSIAAAATYLLVSTSLGSKEWSRGDQLDRVKAIGRHSPAR